MRIFWAVATASVVFVGCGGGGGGKTSPSVDGDCTAVGAVVAIGEDGEVLCGPVVEDYTAFGACPSGQVVSGIDETTGEALCVSNVDGSVTELTAGTGLIGGGQGGVLALSVDTSLVQQRVGGTCPGEAITSVAADGTVTCQALDATADIIGDDGTIESAEITDGTVAGIDIADSTISADDIASGAVGTSEISDGSIDSVDIEDGTIAAADIGSAAVGTSEIADGSVDSLDIEDSTIGSADIANGAIADVDVSDDISIDNMTLYAPAGGGYVGIGTSFPNATLEVAGEPAAINGLDDDYVIRFGDNPGGGAGDIGYMAYGVRSGEATNLELGTGNDSDDHISLITSGSVGINTRTPVDLLDVRGDVRIGFPQSFDTGCLKSRQGNVLVGTCFSDARFKKDIRPFGPVLDRVAALEPVHFRWRSEEFPERHFGKDESYGLVAQDVERVLPELVVEGADGYKSVAYAKLDLYMLQAIRDEHARVQALEAENARLAKRLDALEARVASGGATRSGLGSFGTLGAWWGVPLLVVGLMFERRRRSQSR